MGRNPGLARGKGAGGATLSPEQALLAIVAQLMRESQPAAGGLRAPRLDSSLEDLGIDSLARVELVLRLERAFDLRLPEHLLRSAQTPRDLLNAVLMGAPRAARAAPEAAPLAMAPAQAAVPEEAATLLEALDWHVARHGERTHLVVLGDEDAEGEPVSYAQLRAEAIGVAAGLAQRGVGAGDTVSIMLPTSRDFFRAFLGILLTGAVPVPIYPPTRWAQIGEHLRRQARILGNCGAVMLVTLDEGKRVARMMLGLVPTLAHVVTVADLALPGVSPLLPRPKAADLALLQYTSGSTGDPKGVMLTHANLLANIRAMVRVIAATPDDVFVSWLPLYHDMGLIGAWMGGLYVGLPLVVMPPTAFLNRPARWLRTVHRYRATLSAGPNFSYEICATRVDERDLEGLDLSSWRIAFNGAEPVSPATLERFAKRFARYGFRREASTPVYGLAECAVGLAFPPPGRGPLVDRVDREALTLSGAARRASDDDPDALLFVGCGAPIPGHEIRVVGRDGRELPERAEGRIEFRGPSATSGYYRNPAKTRELFDGDWLDTGDLGYIAGSDVFITSRAKDVIIRGGQHVHPYEVEEAVGNLPGVRKGCVAVFGVPDPASGTEKVVVLAETRLAPGPEREALRERVAGTALALLGTPADDVVIAPPHAVLKTSSGKIRRAASREAYERGLAGKREPAAWRTFARFTLSLVGARARSFARHAGDLAYGAWAWLAASLLGAVALGASLLPSSPRWRSLRALCRAVARMSGIPIAVHGLENVPREGPAILVVNHSSYIDSAVLFSVLPRRVRYVAKRELARNPLTRLLLGAAGAVFIERFDIERGAEDARKLVDLAGAGEMLVFFAEGTFTRAPGLLPFHMGAFVAAAETGAPVVPVAIRGTRSILRDGQWMPRRGAVHVSIGAPRKAESADWRGAAKLRDAVRADVLAACGEPDLASNSNRLTV